MSTQRIAIFGDLHGNSAATGSVLAAVDAESPDAVYCLGDLVGYGARPNETIDLVRERAIPTVMGNYDIPAMAAAIRAAEGLPDQFATDIETGGQPS